MFDDAVEDFLVNLRRGADAQSVVAQLRETYRGVIAEPEPRTAFITALAQAAWQHGHLYPALKDEALALIGTALAAKDNADLSALADVLCSPQPDAVMPQTFRTRMTSMFQRKRLIP